MVFWWQTSQAKYQYVLEDKKQLKARIQYLEKKVDSVTKPATSLENKKNDLPDTLRQALINVIGSHYKRYGKKKNC